MPNCQYCSKNYPDAIALSRHEPWYPTKRKHEDNDMDTLFSNKHTWTSSAIPTGRCKSAPERRLLSHYNNSIPALPTQSLPRPQCSFNGTAVNSGSQLQGGSVGSSSLTDALPNSPEPSINAGDIFQSPSQDLSPAPAPSLASSPPGNPSLAPAPSPAPSSPLLNPSPEPADAQILS
ncbi:hypothetical protein BT96DRAFT_988387 [Gymnopus androsaceus JB14]|uniref:Uncharacterized protein n=1 Tax=Gymnopus androsaceus JB14 TaxID=1447944 RepID=A0A6A4I528_9AGAR|nr:hypothetical protein BT96DRAFT_988387 [Gymnopus androsaceus JB14]